MSSVPIRVVSVVGARPQFVKIAPVSRAFAASRLPIEDLIVHTGQHYDDAMSKVFFDELGIPKPAVNLGIGSGLHGAQTGKMLESIEAFLLERRPDVVVVYGDTNSTLAGALAAAKLHVPVLHVEAGLRSFNRRMPEELNRVATDHLSTLLLAPTAAAVRNLENEGLANRTLRIGDVMYDAVLHNSAIARERSRFLASQGLERGQYSVATVHRAENTTPHELEVLLTELNVAAAEFGPVVFPIHPRTAASIASALPGWAASPSLRLVPPVGYLDMLALVDGARFVLTDSGGLQKEAFFLDKPCCTLRNETEWVETVELGANRIVGSDGAGLRQALREFGATDGIAPASPGSGPAPFGDGDAAGKLLEALLDLVRGRR